MSMSPVTLIVADDERPARKFLVGLLKACAGAQLVGEAASGEEALSLIHTHRPHLALLDLQMPEMGGLEIVRRLTPQTLPLIAFVTAFDDHAIEAFELNAIDYLLKPVQRDRLQSTIDRARERLESRDSVEGQAAAIASAASAYERSTRRRYADRLPLRQRDTVVIVPVRTIASIVSEGELLHIRTVSLETYTITHRLHALESRLDPRKFIRLNRGTLANVDLIAQINPMPGGTYVAVLSDGQELSVSRIQSRALRETLLKL
ncbi:MAG TPA: response regulator transcription factor [Vicinamibacterales bacterium]|jgi:two-component system LytT family response regulator